VAVAGPVGHRLRRLDILALLRWTLPTLKKLVPLPPRLLVVGAGDPMWRGGLSGPSSVFLHSARPLISEDGSSPLLHELLHSALGLSAGPGGDWIVEGLAELYSMELLARSGTMSRRRLERALERKGDRARSVRSLEVDYAEGAVSARAVMVLRALDKILRERSNGEKSLDDVLRLLAERRGKVTTAQLRALAEGLVGQDLSAFFARYVGPGAGAAARP
jgi:hypothetical protein